MAVFIEEQIQALAKMCEALICELHWTDDKGDVRLGHGGYPASGCKHGTCEKYAEAFRQLNFGERSYHMAQLRGENERLFQRIAKLEEQLGINQEVV